MIIKLPLFRRYHRRIFLLVILLLALALTGFINLGSDRPAEPDRWIQVQPKPLAHKIELVGKIEPQQAIVLNAPFDGEIANLSAQIGQTVSAGTVLVEMNTRRLDMLIREADTQRILAQKAMKELDDWHNSTQVLRARRDLSSLKGLYHLTLQQLKDSEVLFKKGIIPRNELQRLQQEVDNQRFALKATEEELTDLLQQANPENKNIAQLELDNATLKYEELATLRDKKNIIAPFSGIVFPLPDVINPASRNTSGKLQSGESVMQGQPLISLADTERLKAITRVAEMDIHQLRPGQDVTIVGDGFQGITLTGKVGHISNIAIADDDPGALAQFLVTVEIDPLTQAQRERVRPGMSIQLSILTYTNAQAIIVPPEAIHRQGDALSVVYREDENAPERPITVTAGRVMAEGIEVFGLPPGLVSLQ